MTGRVTDPVARLFSFSSLALDAPSPPALSALTLFELRFEAVSACPAPLARSRPPLSPPPRSTHLPALALARPSLDAPPGPALALALAFLASPHQGRCDQTTATIVVYDGPMLRLAPSVGAALLVGGLLGAPGLASAASSTDVEFAPVDLNEGLHRGHGWYNAKLRIPEPPLALALVIIGAAAMRLRDRRRFMGG